MASWVYDLVITVLILGMTYALYSEGLWGAALVTFNVMISAIVALNFYEWLAQMMVNAGALPAFADLICMGGLFTVTLILLKVATENIAPTMVKFPGMLDQIGRLAFGLAGATVTMAFLLLVLYTAPVHRHVFGKLTYKSQPPFGMGIDRKMLGFFQWTSGNIFADYGGEQEDSEYGAAKVFDPQGKWLLIHQDARPFPDTGEGKVTEDVGAGGDAAGGEAEGSGSPQANAGADGPGIPGGTAGAAVGLAPTNP